MKRSHLINTFITRPHGLNILSNSPSDQSGPLWAVCGRLYGSVYVKIRLEPQRSRCVLRYVCYVCCVRVTQRNTHVRNQFDLMLRCYVTCVTCVQLRIAHLGPRMPPA